MAESETGLTATYDALLDNVSGLIRLHAPVGVDSRCDCGWVPGDDRDHADHLAALVILAVLRRLEGRS